MNQCNQIADARKRDKMEQIYMIDYFNIPRIVINFNSSVCDHT